MLAAAAIAAAKAHATAIGAQKKIADLRGPDLDWSVHNAQPSPPVNLPALSSIEGPSHMERARVVGYQIEPRTFCALIAPNGDRLQPGDEVFLEAHLARTGLSGKPMPKGYVFEDRKGHHLLALVDGNPHLLVQQAQTLGYAGAMAWSAHQLDLGEIELEEPNQAEGLPRPRG